MLDHIFFKLFAGIPCNTFGAVPLIPFGRWLLPVGAWLLAVGTCHERNDKMETFSEYRYGTVSSWWKTRFGLGLLSGLQKAGLLLLVVLAFNLIAGRPSAPSMAESLKISALWLAHILSLHALFLFLDLVFDKRFLPAALLMLEGVTLVLGCQIKSLSHAMYGTWGMYLQSTWYSPGGFSPAIVFAAELSLAAGAYCAGHVYLKKAGCVSSRERQAFHHGRSNPG